MKRIIFNIFCITAFLYQTACQQKMICPAFHSYFILDVDETRKTFSLFGADSLPKKNWDVEKEKWGVAKDIPDRKKEKEMRIISMNSIYKKIEDPFEQFRREYAESDTVIYVDSAAVLARSRGDDDFQNIDQMIYLHHFGKYLPHRGVSGDLLKEDLKQEEPLVSEEEVETDQNSKKKNKFWPFGKKNKKSKEDQSDLEEEY